MALTINIHHYQYGSNSDETLKDILNVALDNATQIKIILKNQEQIMKTLDEVLTAVGEESTLDDSIITLLNGINQQLKDALSGVTLPPAVQEKVDAVFAGIESNKTKVSEAITANTPAEGQG